MGILRRLFGSSLKAARAAEAQGDLREALRLYGEAGAWAEVIAIQLRLARLEGDAQERLNLLRAAAVSAERLSGEEKAARDARSALAEELLAVARAQGTETELDRRLLEEAVRMATLGGAFGVAGEALRLLGRLEEAAQAFAQAGQLEKMEELFQKIESEQKSANRLRDAFDAYENGMKSGDRRAALEAIRRCTELAPRERSYADLRADLERRFLPPGVLPLWVEEQRVSLVGRFPADIGREAGCRLLLRDPGVSRAHSRILREGEDWVVRDLSSRNGTFLNGVRIASPLPLRGQGSLRLGERSAFEFVVKGDELCLTGSQGLDRGALFVLSPREIRLPELLPGVRFFFQEDHGMIFPNDGLRFLLNGRSCATGVLLIEGDELVISSRRVRVTRDLTL